ncbi:MAG: CHAT domain-containing protein [bacterium]
MATSSQGSCSGTLELPFHLGELSGIIRGVAQTIRGRRSSRGQSPSRDAQAEIEETSVPDVTARDVGVRLYRSLFREDVQSLLDRTLGSVRDRNDGGLRIRLSFDALGEGMAEIASLPWELIARDASELPLAMSRRTVLVRSLDVLHPSDPIPFTPPLRILVVMSNPKGTAQLDLREERDRITREWGRLPGVHVDFERPVLADLRTRFANEDYHVIHYMGHGDFDAKTGRGVLLLEHEDGSPHAIDAEQIRLLVEDEPMLRLVFLNACKTATTSARAGFDPFAGIAAAMIKSGVPAVVAMQFPISDQAAITFADTFYRRIVDGHPVDAAVAEGRKALYSADQSEWATPVLFMRSQDGVLFQRGAVEAPVRPAVTVAAPKKEFEVFLATPSDPVRAVHRQVVRDLEAAGGINVITTVPFAETEHAAAVRALAQTADLFVHLLSDQPGELIDDASERRTYSVEELKIGLESARSQLVLLPDSFDVNAIQDREYADFVRSLLERPRDAQRFEVVRTAKHQMRDEILAKQQRLIEASRAGNRRVGESIQTAYVDLHVSDLPHATELLSYLDERSITPILMPSSDRTPAGQVSLFEENIKKVPLFIVVFGGVGRDWVVSRLNAAVQVVTTSGVSTRIGVYLAPPVKGPDQLRFPPFYDVATSMRGFDSTSVDALIRKASEGATL